MSIDDLNIPRPPSAITICLRGIMCILPIAALAVGATYHHDCPKQPYIPIYLIVLGVFSLLVNLLSVLPTKSVTMVLTSLISLFGFCWFIAGNVWIYSAYEPNYNQTTASTDTYCNKTLYLFAFWTTNLYYILIGFGLLSSCCAACCLSFGGT